MQKDLERRSEKYALASPDHILVATDLTDMAYLVPYVVAQAEATGARIYAGPRHFRFRIRGHRSCGNPIYRQGEGHSRCATDDARHGPADRGTGN